MNRKKYNPIEYLTGFLMGIFFGVMLQGGVIFFYSLICKWLGWGLISLAWWMAIPFPLLTGFFMASAIAGLHLEDY